MLRFQLIETLVHVMLFIMAAGIGSFLNVVIYRLPLGMSVNNPKRSFCPHCKKQIPWYRNLPLITWLAQRGKCAECKAPIPFRYFFVELFTGLLLYAVLLKFIGPWNEIEEWVWVVILFWIFTSLLIAGTFIDIDHYILPHEITFGGLAVGLVGSFCLPQIMGELSHWQGLLWSFIGALAGFGILWLVVELGKLAFGRVKREFPKPVEWNLTQPDEESPPVLTLGDEKFLWEDIFGRPSDRLKIDAGKITLTFDPAASKEATRTFQNAAAEIRPSLVTIKPTEGAPETFKIETVTKLEGQTKKVVIPREAMGLGDVFLLGMIGSFLGWKAVLFTLVAASFLGCIVAVIPRVLKRTEWATKIPFGPYLAGGAMIWLFYGPQLVAWYLDRMRFGGGGIVE